MMKKQEFQGQFVRQDPFLWRLPARRDSPRAPACSRRCTRLGSRSSPEFERVADYSRPECKRVGCCSAQWLSCELFKRRATDSWVRDRAGQPPPRRMCASTMLRSAQCDVERARVLLRSVDRNERHTEEHSRQIVDLVLISDPHLRRIDVNEDQMATWTYQRPTLATDETSVLACKPSLLFRKDGPVVFTKKYVKHTLFSKKEYRRAPRA